MTTDKTITEMAKTFQESVNNTLQESANNGIKLLQNANAAFIETQNKQIKTANDVYNKMINSIQGDGKLDMDLGISGKTITETMQKNMESFSNISKTALKTLTDLGKQANVEAVSNDMKQVFDLYNKQVEELTKLNQQSFDAIVKQFDASKSSFSPLTENLKKELDTILDSSKESIQNTMNSYTKFIASSVEANKEVFDKFVAQINTGINANLKAWQELMNLPNVLSKESDKSSKEQPKSALNGSIGIKKQGSVAVN